MDYIDKIADIYWEEPSYSWKVWVCVGVLQDHYSIDSHTGFFSVNQTQM